MKSSIILLTTLVIVSVSSAEWQTEIVDPGGLLWGVSLKLDTDDNPHLSYSRGVLEAWAFYASNIGSTWQVDTIGGSGFGSSFLVLDSTNDPHISLSEVQGVSTGLRYAYHNGISWLVDPVDNTTTCNSSIVLDSFDNPHIGYTDRPNDYLKYAYWDGSDWQIEIIDSSCTEIGGLSSLSLDSSDYPHISYIEESEDNLMYAFFNGATWNTETVDFCNGWYNSLALDSFGKPHIAYTVINSVADSDLRYAYFNGSSWQVQTVDSLGEVGKCCSIALDSNDYPCISYRDDDNWMLKYACWDGSDWQIESVDGFEGQGSSLALNSTDAAHIAYCTSDGVKYAWQIETGIEPEVGTATFILNPIYPNPTSGSFAVEFEISENTIIKSIVFDITGRIIARTESTAYSPGIHQLSYSDLSTGFYICRVHFDSYSENRCLIVIN